MTSVSTAAPRRARERRLELMWLYCNTLCVCVLRDGESGPVIISRRRPSSAPTLSKRVALKF